ncbi:MAG: sigma-70 family RNA polymerase sigma factor [Clostridiales bacterium]|uniref:RNA polymerase sigma factor n=1 Tax=Clostridium sp. N3C TaxID=1776758 RepID=UPI00092DFF94|nr:sigma-70 family RNA polymerase sigma factor [Clostridium sp. N3C]NLZ47174.1 sigma-70 family RNA polymerase sigma factor [Clostridiales bacterium]SCN23602.1 Sigma-W factor [Clostridium sp. N3C]
MFFIMPSAENKIPDIEILIEEYSKSLIRICYMILKDEQLAEEAAFDTLYKAYKNYKNFRRDCSEKTWITSIAINTCKTYMRKSAYKEIASGNYISLAYASEEEMAEPFRSDDSIALLNAIYALPIKYKQVILLRYYQEMTVSEIAKALKEKENTISVRIKRAKEMLKELLKEEF